MPEPLEIHFLPLSSAPAGTVALLAGQELALAAAARGLDERTKGRPDEGSPCRRFQRQGQIADRDPGADRHRQPAPAAAGHRQDAKELDRLLLGGYALAQISARKGETATILSPSRPIRARRAPRFSPPIWRWAPCFAATPSRNTARASPRGGAEDEPPATACASFIVLCAKPDAAAKPFAARKAVADGVFLARDLVNEPANMLGPVEFAERMRELAARRPRGRGARRGPAQGL